MALALALLALGEFLGLERPDTISFAYDVVDNLKVEDDTRKDARKESVRESPSGSRMRRDYSRGGGACHLEVDLRNDIPIDNELH
jgi:hypothetical protein